MRSLPSIKSQTGENEQADWPKQNAKRQKRVGGGE
jgi:hypothetical protein